MGNNFTIFSFDFTYTLSALSSFIPALITVCILIYAVYSSRKAWFPYTFTLFNAGLFFWQLSATFMHLSPTKLHAETWTDVFIAGILLIAPAGLHFVLQFTGYIKKIHFTVLHVLLYVPALLFYILYQLQVWRFEVHHHSFWNYYQIPMADSLSIYVATWMAMCTLLSVIFLFNNYLTSEQKTTHKRQAKVILIGFSIPVIISIITELVLPVIFLSGIAPISSIAMVSFPIATIIAYKNYHLFDFKIESHWKQVLDSHHQGVIIIDLNKKVQYCNEAFYNLSHYTPEQVKETTIEAIVEDCPKKENIRHHVLMRSKLTTSKGRIPAEFSCLPFYKYHDHIIGFICFVRDLSEEKIVEGLLEDSEKRYNSVVKASPDAIIITDGQFNILNWNQGAEQIFGYTTSESHHLCLSSLFPGCTNKDLISSNVKGAYSTVHDKKLNEVSVINKKGDSFFAEYSFHSYNKNNKTYYCFIIRDITTRKSTEANLVKVNRDLNTFIYRASHDLRGPVATLMGVLQLINDTSISKQQLRGYLEMINTTTLKLNEIIDEFLQIAEVNQHLPDQEKIDLPVLFDNILDSLKRYTSNPTSIYFIYPEQSTIIGDRQLLNAIITALLSNAIKYTHHPNAEVQLTIKPINDQLLIEVADNGDGIREEIHHKIFNIFFRGNAKSQGAGFGLFIVQQALEKLNGSIDFTSSPKNGTVFTVSIPYTGASIGDNKLIKRKLHLQNRKRHNGSTINEH